MLKIICCGPGARIQKNQPLKVNMKKMIRFLSVTAVLATAAAAAQAQVYVEGAIAPLTLKDSEAPVLKAKPTVLTGIVGYEINPNVAVEGLLGLGLNKSSVTVGGTSTNIDAKISTSYGIFVKPKVMVSNEVELFARLGYASSKLKLSTSGASRSETESSFAYGLGGNYYLNKQTYLTASYMSLYSKDGVKATGLSIGVGYKF